MKNNKEKAIENPLISVTQLPLGKDKSHGLMETCNMPVRVPVDAPRKLGGSDGPQRSVCLASHGLAARAEHMKMAEFLRSKTAGTG